MEGNRYSCGFLIPATKESMKLIYFFNWFVWVSNFVVLVFAGVVTINIDAYKGEPNCGFKLCDTMIGFFWMSLIT